MITLPTIIGIKISGRNIKSGMESGIGDGGGGGNKGKRVKAGGGGGKGEIGGRNGNGLGGEKGGTGGGLGYRIFVKILLCDTTEVSNEEL